MLHYNCSLKSLLLCAYLIRYLFHVVCVAFKFHVERGAGPREAIDYWKEYLTTVRIHKVVNTMSSPYCRSFSHVNKKRSGYLL